MSEISNADYVSRERRVVRRRGGKRANGLVRANRADWLGETDAHRYRGGV